MARHWSFAGGRTLRPGGPPLEIALVNNMPDAAFAATEHQFVDLLTAAAGGREVAVRLTSLRPPDRATAIGHALAGRYETLAQLRRRPPDALVVTGSEPRCTALREETTFSSLEVLLAWAEEETASVLASCLAAHGALLVGDGIERRRLPTKLAGVFDQEVDPAHPLTAGITTFACPHSRLHDVAPVALEATGYTILAGAPAAGWSVAARDGACLRLLVQGHPEYEATTLLREHRRDARRFLAGELDTYPALPANHLDAPATALLEAFGREATGPGRSPSLAARYPFEACAARLDAPWRTPMVRLVANWLTELQARKAGDAGRRAG